MCTCICLLDSLELVLQVVVRCELCQSSLEEQPVLLTIGSFLQTLKFYFYLIFFFFLQSWGLNTDLCMPNYQSLKVIEFFMYLGVLSACVSVQDMCSVPGAHRSQKLQMVVSCLVCAES